MDKQHFLKFLEKLINPKTEEKVVFYDFRVRFKADFADEVMKKIRQSQSIENIEWVDIRNIFYRFTFTGSALVFGLLMYTFFDVQTLDLRAIFGLTNDFSDIFYGFNL